jgi:hypothetical protein
MTDKKLPYGFQKTEYISPRKPTDLMSARKATDFIQKQPPLPPNNIMQTNFMQKQPKQQSDYNMPPQLSKKLSNYNILPQPNNIQTNFMQKQPSNYNIPPPKKSSNNMQADYIPQQYMVNETVEEVDEEEYDEEDTVTEEIQTVPTRRDANGFPITNNSNDKVIIEETDNVLSKLINTLKVEKNPDNTTSTENSIELDVNYSKKIKVILFKADWCGHCKRFKPEWEKLKNCRKLKDMIHFETIDSNKDRHLMDKHQVSGVPTVMYSTDDKFEEYEKYEGNHTQADLVQFLNNLLNTKNIN